eukprot:Gb_00493 [translate_table: standard]
MYPTKWQWRPKFHPDDKGNRQIRRKIKVLNLNSDQFPSNPFQGTMPDSTSATNSMFSPSTMHLEKMGGELKCPICLSLFDQAASLTCNHIFCNACILKSMKSGSVCPVCKVPFARREVRLAPHMDSLVNIYRNMELAAGINLFVSQPIAAADSTGNIVYCVVSDGREEKNSSCPNDLKQKPPVLPGRKRKKVEGFSLWNRERNPTRLAVSSDVNTDGLQQKTPDQPIPSPHQPVKHSFPAKKRVQVSLYPPGSTLETPLRTVKKASHSGTRSTQNEIDGNGEVLALGGSSGFHSDSNAQVPFCPQAKLDPAGLSSMTKVPSADGLLLDDLGNPVLAPFFWLRDHDSEEVDGAQLLTSQPTQTTQIAQTPPPACPTFSDLKDSDDEGSNYELESDEANTGITIPDTFDIEMFEWTQRPCSPELTSTPIKQQVLPKSLVVFPGRILQDDDALIGNGSNESSNTISPAKDAENSKIEDAFEAMILFPEGSTVAEVPDAHNKEKAGASDETCNGNPTNAHIGTKDAEETIQKKDIKLNNGAEQALSSKKSQRKMRPKSTGGIQAKPLCKRKKHRRSKKGNGGNSVEELFSPANDSVADCSSDERKPQDPNKELSIKAADIFKAMFSSPSDFATDTTIMAKASTDTKIQEQDQNLSPDLSENEVPVHSVDNLTLKHQSGVESITNGDNMKAINQVCTPEMQTTGSCCRNEPTSVKSEIVCVFCRSSCNSEIAGQMMHYSNGKAIVEQEEMPLNVIHVHKYCAEWSPDVYFVNDCVMNLEAEVARGIKIKCSSCGVKGAALGCCVKKCRKSFHVPCALSTPGCRWDVDNFVMLCPTHSSCKFPKERRRSTSNLNQDSPPSRRVNQSSYTSTPCGLCANSACSCSKRTKSPAGTRLAAVGTKSSQVWTWPPGLACKWVLCGSALNIPEKEQLAEFASIVGATVSKTWSPTVTHVIACTDANGACRRTLKFLMAILEGKWILKTDWIAACTKAGHPVDEELFEITHDIHGTFEGPKRGRARVEKKAPKLFEGLSFYFSGEFAASSKKYLQDLALAAGGVVLHRKPIMDQPEVSLEVKRSNIVLYNVEFPENSESSDETVQRRFMDAKSLADATGAQVAPHTWLLESIAACQLQPMVNGCN